VAETWVVESLAEDPVSTWVVESLAEDPVSRLLVSASSSAWPVAAAAAAAFSLS